MRYRVINLTRNTLLATDATAATTFVSRFKGLMGVSALPPGRGLYLRPCNSVHTFFMRMSIDVAFLSPSHIVIDTVGALRPWRVSRVYFDAKAVLELPEGTLATSHTVAGDRLAFEPLA